MFSSGSECITAYLSVVLGDFSLLCETVIASLVVTHRTELPELITFVIYVSNGICTPLYLNLTESTTNIEHNCLKTMGKFVSTFCSTVQCGYCVDGRNRNRKGTDAALWPQRLATS